MTRIEFRHPAGEYERFALHAFDRTVGQEVPFKIKGIEHGMATVVAVQVAEDGKSALFTIDLPDGMTVPAVALNRAPASFAFEDIPDIPERWWEGSS